MLILVDADASALDSSFHSSATGLVPFDEIRVRDLSVVQTELVDMNVEIAIRP